MSLRGADCARLLIRATKRCGDPIPNAVAESSSEVVLVLPDNSRDPELTQVLQDAQRKYFVRKRQR